MNIKVDYLKLIAFNVVDNKSVLLHGGCGTGGRLVIGAQVLGSL